MSLVSLCLSVSVHMYVTVSSAPPSLSLSLPLSPLPLPLSPPLTLPPSSTSVLVFQLCEWRTESQNYSKGRGFESLQERRENFPLQGQLSCADSYFGIRSTPVLPQ